MSEWKKVKLGDILDFYNGKAIKVTNGPIPVYGSNGIIGYTEKPLYHNAIIIGRVGAYCGSVAICQNAFWASDNTIIVKAKNGESNIFYYFLLKIMNLNLYAGGAAQPLITQTTLKSLETAIPPINTQRLIATILSRYDSLIENYQKQIKLLEEAAQRLYKEWFVDLHFPGHENTKIVDGVPEGWEKKKLVEIAELKAGGDKPEIVSAKRTNECSVPIFSNGTTNEGLYGYTNLPVILEQSVTISARGSVGYTVFRRTPFVPIVRLISVTPHNIYVGYIFYCLKSTTLDSNGAAQQQITIPMIRNKEITIPSKGILELFESQTEPIFNQIDILKELIRLLTEARDRLLPKLMSGEIKIESLK